MIYIYNYNYTYVLADVQGLASSLNMLGDELSTAACGAAQAAWIWLVVSTPLKNMKVSWDDYSQCLEKYKPCSNPALPWRLQNFTQLTQLKRVSSTHQSACIVHSKFLDPWGPGQTGRRYGRYGPRYVTKRYPVDSLHEGCSMMFTYPCERLRTLCKNPWQLCI